MHYGLHSKTVIKHIQMHLIIASLEQLSADSCWRSFSYLLDVSCRLVVVSQSADSHRYLRCPAKHD